MRAERRTLTVDGRCRRYLLVPPAQRDEPADVLLFFHGSKQSGSVARRFTNYTFEQARAGAAVVYPDGVHNHFNDGRRILPEETRRLGIDDVAFTRAIMDDLRASFSVGRVFAAGFSNGGHMVQRLLIDAPGLLDGAAPPVELWSVDGMGHLVPAGIESPDPRLGKATAPFIAADAITRFFGLS